MGRARSALLPNYRPDGKVLRGRARKRGCASTSGLRSQVTTPKTIIAENLFSKNGGHTPCPDYAAAIVHSGSDCRDLDMVQSILTVAPRLPPPTHDINTAENTHALHSLTPSLTDSHRSGVACNGALSCPSLVAVAPCCFYTAETLLSKCCPIC